MADVDGCCKRWLRRSVPDATVLGDMTVRLFKRPHPHGPMTMITRDENGKIFKCKRGDIDLYICGFPCNPWSSRGSSGEDGGWPHHTQPVDCKSFKQATNLLPEGMREGFAAKDAQCFFAAVKTISATRPRAFILENVPSVLDKPHIGKLSETLDKLKDFKWKASVVDSFNFGVPQRRRRAYIVGIRSDGDPGDTEDMLRDIFEDMTRVHHRSSPWPKYLKAPQAKRPAR